MIDVSEVTGLYYGRPKLARITTREKAKSELLFSADRNLTQDLRICFLTNGILLSQLIFVAIQNLRDTHNETIANASMLDFV